MADGAYNDSDKLSYPIELVEPWNDLETTYNTEIDTYDDLTRTVADTTKTGKWNDS